MAYCSFFPLLWTQAKLRQCLHWCRFPVPSPAPDLRGAPEECSLHVEPLAPGGDGEGGHSSLSIEEGRTMNKVVDSICTCLIS